MKPAVRRALRRLKLPSVIYQYCRFEGVFEVEIESFRRFVMFSYGDSVENDLYWFGFGKHWEGRSLRMWRDLARDAGVIIDVGANTGVYALSAACVNPSATIVALEPVKRVFDKLERNIKINGFDIDARLIAASNRTGVATLFDHPTEHVYSASLERGMPGVSDATTSTVQTVTIDVLATALGGLDLVKIDVERHEPAVIRGMNTSIGRYRPVVMVEILDADVLERLRSEFSERGYSCLAVDDREDRVLSGDSEHRPGNYVFFDPVTSFRGRM